MTRTLTLAAVLTLNAMFTVNVSADNMVGPGQPHYDLNKKVVQYCLSNEGKTIDRGECWDVAAAALKYADAKQAVHFDFGQKYDWRSQEIWPGDIIQFGVSKLKSTGPITQHTAVVLENQGNKKLKIAHQNVGGQRFIVFEVKDFTTATGQIDFSHPVLPEGASPRPAAPTPPGTPTMPPTSTSPTAGASGFPTGNFHMTTRWSESRGLVLESAPVELRKRDNLTGMNWKAIPAGNGFFYLTSEYLESKGQVLEGSDGSGAAIMVPNKGYSGTMWKAIPSGDGFYFLTSAFMEQQGKVLESGDPEAVNGKYKGGPYMQDKNNASQGAHWKFLPMN